jgi:hypothetical protein
MLCCLLAVDMMDEHNAHGMASSLISVSFRFTAASSVTVMHALLPRPTTTELVLPASN